MSIELKQQILTVMGVLLVPLFIGIFIWGQRLRQNSGWSLIEKRFRQKDKFTGNWQINTRMRLQAIKGFFAVDVGFDDLYLYLRPTEHGDLVKKSVQIPWSEIVQASESNNRVEIHVNAGEHIVLSLECPPLRQVEHINRLLRDKKH